MPQLVQIKLSELKKDVAPPKESLGYVAPTVGTFYLNGPKGHATFVWYHEKGLVVDIHDHDMEFLSIHPVGGIEFFVYRVLDDEGGPFFVFLARTQADTDEGYRIFYGVDVAPGPDRKIQLHLWAYDARTFHGHA